ncbi:hypothetical protein TorRG33x02_337050, partial [Trema orientale]
QDRAPKPPESAPVAVFLCRAFLPLSVMEVVDGAATPAGSCWRWRDLIPSGGAA